MPQIDTARTRHRTSLGPGVGTGTSRISVLFGSRTTSACMVAVKVDSFGWREDQITAMGSTIEAVAPRIFTGSATNRNS